MSPILVFHLLLHFVKFYNKMAIDLGKVIRDTMNWEIIYQQYKKFMEECF